MITALIKSLSKIFLAGFLLMAVFVIGPVLTMAMPFFNETAGRSDNKIFAYHIEWEESSFKSLQYNLNKIDYVLPVWLNLDSRTANLKLIDGKKMQRTINFINQNKAENKIIPVINNFDNASQSWSAMVIKNLLDNPDKQTKLISDLKNFVLANGFAGISLDLENMPDNYDEKILQFNSRVYEEFHNSGLLVMTSVPLENHGLDLNTMAQSNDYVILMAYDQHWETSDPGPVASQDWYEKNLQIDQQQIPAEKLVIGIGNYGYEWIDSGRTKSRTFDQILTTAKKYKADFQFDYNSLNPWFEFTDERNRQHKIYYLDAITAFNQKLIAQKNKPAGYALWRLGSEDQEFWKVVRYDFDGYWEYLRMINTFPEKGFDWCGQNFSAQKGIREINFNQDRNLITWEKTIKYPQINDNLDFCSKLIKLNQNSWFLSIFSKYVNIFLVKR